MGTNECSQPASKSSWDNQDFGDVNMVLKMVHFHKSSRPQWVNNKPVNALAPDGDKPSSEPMTHIHASVDLLGIHCRLTLHVRSQAIKGKCWFEHFRKKLGDIWIQNMYNFIFYKLS